MAGINVTGPDGSTFTFPEGTSSDVITGAMRSHYNAQPQDTPAKAAPQGFAANALDFAKSIPHGVMQGVSDTLSNTGKAAAAEMSDPDLAASIPDAKETQAALEKNVTGETRVPEGRAGRFGAAIGEGLGNPTTYVGPGGMALKLGGSLLSSLGGEAGGQAAEGTGYERAARLGGALLGGATAVKTLGTTAEKAAVPTLQELKASADSGYTAARNSWLELHPKALSDFAAPAQQELTNGPKYAFTGGQNGTAPKTFAILDDLQAAPNGARVTAPNLDTIRLRINNVAGETGLNGKPTADAKAAMVLKSKYSDFLQNLPEDHILAGDPEAYVGAIKQANGDYAALSRGQTIDQKLTSAENNANGGIATSPDNQIKSAVRSILNKPKAQRGFSADELGQMQTINDGTLVSNTLRQLGRGGAGVIPMAMHLAAAAPTAIATGGISLPIQAALAAGLYGAKKASERITKNRAQDLADALAKRSPLYEQRVNALPPSDAISNKSALARALLTAR